MALDSFTPDPAPNLMFHTIQLKRACEAETEGHVDEELLRLGRHFFVGIRLLALLDRRNHILKPRHFPAIYV